MKDCYKILFAAIVMLLALQGCEPTGTSTPGDEFFDKLGRSCVEVLADGKMAGSGAFVSSDGYVLTAGHFITGPEMKLEVLSTTAGRNAAKLVAIDKGHDLALPDYFRAGASTRSGNICNRFAFKYTQFGYGWQGGFERCGLHVPYRSGFLY